MTRVCSVECKMEVASRLEFEQNNLNKVILCVSLTVLFINSHMYCSENESVYVIYNVK